MVEADRPLHLIFFSFTSFLDHSIRIDRVEGTRKAISTKELQRMSTYRLNQLNKVRPKSCDPALSPFMVSVLPLKDGLTRLSAQSP